MRRIRTFLITGLVVLLPAAVSLWIAWRVAAFMDSLFGIWADYLTMSLFGFRVPGLGLVLTLSFIVFVGAFATNYVGRRLIELGERILLRLPFIRWMYTTTKQVVDAVAATNRDAFKRVVLVEYPRKGIYAVAFVTGAGRGEVQDVTAEDVINVFLPTTPNPTSGFLLLVPRHEVIPLEMSVEDGLKLVISGGVVSPGSRDPVPVSNPAVVSPGDGGARR